MDDDTNGSKTKLVAALAVLIVIAVIVGGGVSLAHKNQTVAPGASTTQSTASPTTTTDTGTSSVNSSTAYKDGTYSATGGYGTPGGPETINLTLTISNGTVTSTSATTSSTDRESREYDDRFLAAYKTQVVGKDVNQISLSRVSGASLTTQGFTNALQKIESEAQA